MVKYERESPLHQMQSGLSLQNVKPTPYDQLYSDPRQQVVGGRVEAPSKLQALAWWPA